MARRALILCWPLLVFVAASVAEEPNTAPPNKPQWQRMLKGDDAKLAADLQKRIETAEKGDRYDEAIRMDEELLALRTKAQGADHWETVNERWAMDADQKIGGLPVERRADWRRDEMEATRARQLEAENQYAKAEPFRRTYLRRCEQVFGKKHPNTATSYNDLAYNLNEQAKYAEAQTFCQLALDVRRELLGEKNPNTAASYNHAGYNLAKQGKYAEAQPLFQRALDLQIELLGEKHAGTALYYNNAADSLSSLGRYAEAQPLFEKALKLRVELLGEKYADTVLSYNNLASNLASQQKHAEAQPLYQRTLDLFLDLLGEKHPITAMSYNNLAGCLNSQGKYAEAQPLFRKALELRLQLLGENHLDIAISCNNLAGNLADQANYAEAQPLFEKALKLNIELLGEKHPATAHAYTGVAGNLRMQGRYAEAQPLFEKALKLNIELLGEKHPATAHAYTGVAANLRNQQKYAEAQRMSQRALDLYAELFGEKYLNAADAYDQMGGILAEQGNHAAAQVLFQKALRLRVELLGDKHPLAAFGYSNLAATLFAQREDTEAQDLFEKALHLRIESFGERHPDTASSFASVAAILTAHGEHASAEAYLKKACAGYETARLNVIGDGLERAVFGEEHSPYQALAVAQAHLGKASAAWSAAEADLARGSNDEAALRHGVTSTPDEQDRRSKASSRYGELQRAIVPLVSKRSRTGQEEEQLRKFHVERARLEGELAELAVSLSQREVATLEEVQAAIPPNAALVVWADTVSASGRFEQHWGCVVRNRGVPAWERLPGTQGEEAWDSYESRLPFDLLRAVMENASPAIVNGFAQKLYSQRVAPLEVYLQGVQLLFVVPVGAMAAVPLELLTDKCTVSYVPSGTFLARMKGRSGAIGDDVLALGDPVFPPIADDHQLPLPPGGLLIAQVSPGGNAAQARVQSGDVLLKYAAANLVSREQLGKLIEEHVHDKTVAVTVWRAGETVERELQPGKLGVMLDPRPAPQALADKRKTDVMWAQLTHGGDWSELPGTAAETAVIGKLAGAEHAVRLTRSAASEQELERLRASGELAKFRYLHFATHGEPNNARSFESALILSLDQITGDIPHAGEKYYDGRLTANEVLENWKLDADLVTLSACESALGRPGGGDGLLGFAQAFLLAGARSVCLSLWKVDDAATALLMDRFYQNLLGKREGLSQPMPKAEALAEAKRWLRELTLDEATKLTADMTKGVVRGKNDPALKLVVPAADPAMPAKPGDRPFAHPRYWAAFILIGDPN